MRLNLKAAPALAVLALVMLASGAAKAQTTADQVVDNETLKAFVEGAKAEIEAITDINEGAKLRDRLRTEGPWKSGSMFLIIFLKSGEPFIHGNDRTAESKNLLGVEDERGTQGRRGTPRGRCPRRRFRRILRRGTEDGIRCRIHLGDHRKTIRAGRRLLAGRLPCPNPGRR